MTGNDWMESSGQFRSSELLGTGSLFPSTTFGTRFT
jgi:hypothetical protein